MTLKRKGRALVLKILTGTNGVASHYYLLQSVQHIHRIKVGMGLGYIAFEGLLTIYEKHCVCVLSKREREKKKHLFA